MRNLSIFVLSLVAALLGGLWIGTRMGAADGALHAQASVEPSRGDLSLAKDERLLQDLVSETRGLRSDLASQPHASGAREAVGASGGSGVPELTAAVKELVALLRDRAAVGAGGSTGSLFARVPTAAVGFADLGAVTKASDADRSKAHFFWTVQQVIDRYGVPSQMNVHEGELELMYLDSDANGGFTTFSCMDGLVIRVQ